MVRSVFGRFPLLTAAALGLGVTLALPVHAGVPKVGKGVPKAEPLKPTAPSSGTKRARSTSDRRTVSGTVLSMDPSKGTALVQTRDGIIEVRARPTDAAMMQPGAKTELSVEKVGKELWLEPAAPSGYGSADVSQQPGMGAAASTEGNPIFQQRGRATGKVTDVDLEAGTFIVDGKKLTAHPSVLKDLKAGSSITVDFGVVGENGWADRLYTAPPGEAHAGEPTPPQAPRAEMPAPAEERDRAEDSSEEEEEEDDE